MRFQAIVFDLFGTLVDFLPAEVYNQSFVELAHILDVPADRLRQAWASTRDKRDVGTFGGLEGDIRNVCSIMDISPTPAQIADAVDIRLKIIKKNIEPREGAIQMLQKLKSSGYQTAMITVCASEVPRLWPETSFRGLIDIPVFSSTIGICKPDPRIYKAASILLDVPPQRCLYIGDGSYYELAGAEKAGMHPVLIRVGYDRDEDANRPEAVEWRGSVISHLSEVMDYLDKAAINPQMQISTGYVINPMCIDDYDEVVALWSASEGVGLDQDTDSRSGVRAYLDRNPGMSFVARYDGKLVGAALCGHDGRRGYLHHLAVDPSYRNNGVGRALSDSCLNALENAGINKCNIMVFDQNLNAQRFWRIIGWKERKDLRLMQSFTACDVRSADTARKS